MINKLLLFKVSLVLILSVMVIVYLNIKINYNPVDNLAQNCSTKVQKTINGISMSGIFEDGDEIEVINNYYECTGDKVQREDVVLFSYSEKKNPLIKVVKAIPGDIFSLQATLGGWNIIVNNKLLKNSYGQPYVIDETKRNMLSLYERDYGGVIPINSYMILGNRPDGTKDSTYFGLVGKSSLIAKAVIN